MLSPCSLCNRHVQDGTPCPFCQREQARQARRASGLGLAVAAATAGVALGACAKTETKQDTPEAPAIEAPKEPVSDDTKISDKENSGTVTTQTIDASLAAKVEATDAALVAETTIESDTTVDQSAKEKAAKELAAKEAAAAKRKQARELAKQRELERLAEEKPIRPERPMVARYGIRPRQPMPPTKP